MCSGFVWCMHAGDDGRPSHGGPPGRGHGAGYSSDNSVQMLSVLTPDSRTLVLASMSPFQRCVAAYCGGCTVCLTEGACNCCAESREQIRGSASCILHGVTGGA